jgi:hypothetical protein
MLVGVAIFCCPHPRTINTPYNEAVYPPERKTMNPLKVIKATTGIVVSFGAGAIVNNAIKATTPADVHAIKKIALVIGGFAVSGIVADAAVKYSNKTFDDVDEAIKNVKVHKITDVE